MTVRDREVTKIFVKQYFKYLETIGSDVIHCQLTRDPRKGLEGPP